MTVNVPLLRKALEWAYEQYQLAERGLPSEWDQGSWIKNTPWVSCGTVCCIAGKVSLEAGWRPLHGDGSAPVIRDGKIDYADDVAARELGLNPGQASRLFSGGNTIEQLYAIAGRFTDGEITAPPELDLSWVPDVDSYECSCGCGLVF